MTHDNVSKAEAPLPVPTQREVMSLLAEHTRALQASKKQRGRPALLSWTHLCLALVSCFLQGWQVQLDLWRFIRREGIGPFAPVPITDQAIYNRLARAGEPMRRFFEQVSLHLRASLEDWQDRRLAPFAQQVLALDESTLDQVARWLPELRDLAKGHPELLAGRISALFDVRLQQWVRVDGLEKAKANCKDHARAMWEGLCQGTLLLFDRGYLSFPLFDDLTERGLWWISRYANKVTYEIRHICYQGDGVLDAIVYLGKRSSDQAKYPVRLIRFWLGAQQYCYLTNVLDPRQLSLHEVVQLYARRWDIELAFRLLKEHLHLNLVWSAKWPVVQVQLWCGLLLAQLFHALQVQIARQAGVEVFDVSMELLVRYTPRLLEKGVNPVTHWVSLGRDLGVIRPSSRRKIQTPWVDPAWVCVPPPQALLPRDKARYAQRHCAPRSKKAG